MPSSSSRQFLFIGKVYNFLGAICTCPIERSVKDKECLQPLKNRIKLKIWKFFALLTNFYLIFILYRLFQVIKENRVVSNVGLFFWAFVFLIHGYHQVNLWLRGKYMAQVFNDAVKIHKIFKNREYFQKFNQSDKDKDLFLLALKFLVFQCFFIAISGSKNFLIHPNDPHYIYSVLSPQIKSSRILFVLFFIFEFMIRIITLSSLAGNLLFYVFYIKFISFWLANFKKVLGDKSFGTKFNGETYRFLKDFRALKILTDNLNELAAFKYYIPYGKAVGCGLIILSLSFSIKYHKILKTNKIIHFMNAGSLATLLLFGLIQLIGHIDACTREIAQLFKSKPNHWQKVYKAYVRSLYSFGLVAWDFYRIKYNSILIILHIIIHYTITVILL